MLDFFTFRTMIMPIFIQVFFWLGSIIIVIVGLVSLLAGEFLPGLGMIVLGPLMIRIYCEILILFFRMNETLTEIRNQLKQNGSRPAAAYTESI